MYGLPWGTHRWVVEEVSSTNLKLMLFMRFIKFVDSIMKTTKPALRFLLKVVAADVRSLSGSNLRSILRTTGIQVIPGMTRAGSVKKLKIHKVPEGQDWKIPLLHSLISVKAGEFYIPLDDESDDTLDPVEDILMDLCLN